MTTRTAPLALAPLLAAGLLIAACGSEPPFGSTPAGGTASPRTDSVAVSPFPVTVESCGHEYTYERAPQRVLLGFPGTLETLQALGVADRAHGYALGGYAPLPDGYPGDVVEVSPDYAPSREAVIAAAPDLFIANDEGQVTGEGTVGYEDLAGVGANTYVLGDYCVDGPAPRSLDGIYDDVTDLGAVFGVPEAAAELNAELRGRVAAARAALADQQLRIAFVQAFDGKLYAISGYPASNIIEALGQTNEFGDLKENFAEISREAALTRTPDAVFVNYSGDGESEAVAEVEKVLAGTPAVEAGQVYGVDEWDSQAGAVSIIDELEHVADHLAR